MRAQRHSLPCAAALLFSARLAQAVIGTPDNVPAATLLLPYFEVDTHNTVDQLGHVPGAYANTIFQVRNHDSAPHLAHVTLWTDYGIPSRSFDIYLTGGDVQDVDLRLAFAGVLPSTGPGISNLGSLSAAHVNFPGCPAIINPTRLSAADIDALRAAHTGAASASFGGKCASKAYGDTVARGYVTVDVVQQCSSAVPGDNGYFVAGGSGIASNANVLSGEYSITDGVNNAAFGDRLISVEASSSDPLTSAAGAYTFYSGVAGDSRDNREGLPTKYSARYASGGVTGTRSSLLIWRDARAKVIPVTCASAPPAPWPVPAREILLFDEQTHASLENVARPAADLAAQRAEIGSDVPANGIYSPYTFGMVMINLSDATAVQNPDQRRQAWVVSVRLEGGRYETGQSAIAIDKISTAPVACMACGNANVPVVGGPPPGPASKAKAALATKSATRGKSGTHSKKKSTAAVTHEVQP